MKSESKTRVQIPIPHELHRALKIRCATEGITMQIVLANLLTQYMKGYKPPKA